MQAFVSTVDSLKDKASNNGTSEFASAVKSTHASVCQHQKYISININKRSCKYKQ
ncbi:hypothetical protein [Staphylococcus pseudintermedius]|uniref:hypothetical protein n=1 Tax=Staphylococcus pseudintermedius TaxID=283734 RepID=UPI0013EF5D5E|nr:hypothetical protein [Staphylococcus pseudintermedius]